MKNCHFRTILYYNFLWFTSGLLAANFMVAQKVWDLNEKPWTLLSYEWPYCSSLYCAAVKEKMALAINVISCTA